MKGFGKGLARLSKNIWIELGFCFLLSALFLLLGTKSSPLYPFNDWVDTNVSFTVGKGMMNGKVLYRDIFEQRGPLLYLIYGLGYLLSNRTFLGVFIFEVVSFSFFLFFCYKSISLYLSKSYSLIALPIIAASVINLESFSHGGSPEEFCLPFVAFSLYYLLKYFAETYPKPIPDKWIFINGLVAGCVLWVKFSILGFWIGWIGSILILLLIKKDFVGLFKYSGLFLLGMVTATIPWIVYFGLNNAIPEWINSYFVVNLTAYSQSMTLVSRIKFILLTVYGVRFVVGLPGLGFFVFLTKRNYIKNLVNKLSVAFCFVLLAVTVYGGGQVRNYYSLIFAPFIIFGLTILLDLYSDDYGKIKSVPVLISTIFIIVISSFFLILYTNHNVDMLRVDREDLVQYKYAQVINETENATLLNYGWLDSGFFTTTGIVPTTRFFHQPNIEYSRYPLIRDEQNRYIREAVTDYIVYPIRIQDYKGVIDIPYLNENYELIRDDIQRFEGTDYRYLLFKKIN